MSQSFNALQIGDMTFQDLKDQIKLIGADKLNMVMQDWPSHESEGELPCLKLLDKYSVIFQDPVKPPATVFKAWPCHAGDEFFVTGFRSTKANPVIILLEPGDNVARNMKRHAVGSGLNSHWKVAEFTMSKIRDTRMNARDLLESVLLCHHRWCTVTYSDDTLYDGEMAGSW